jgi:hypothetical protein
MMGVDFLLFDSAGLCFRALAFHIIAERRGCPLKARDVRAW